LTFSPTKGVLFYKFKGLAQMLSEALIFTILVLALDENGILDRELN